jgi:Mg2+/Co2+ transporter CorB
MTVRRIVFVSCVIIIFSFSRFNTGFVKEEEKKKKRKKKKGRKSAETKNHKKKKKKKKILPVFF